MPQKASVNHVTNTFFETAQKKRVLVLDDDPIIREIAKVKLYAGDYNVVSMEDGLFNEELWERLTFDAAIVDLGLPSISGLDVMHRIRSKQFGRNIPLFVVTSSIDLSDVRQCYDRYGVSFVFSKPIDWEFLMERLNTSLDESAVGLTPELEHLC